MKKEIKGRQYDVASSLAILADFIREATKELKKQSGEDLHFTCDGSGKEARYEII